MIQTGLFGNNSDIISVQQKAQVTIQKIKLNV